MRGKVLWGMVITFFVGLVVLFAVLSQAAEVEVASLDSGKPCTWQRDIETADVTDGARAAKAPETSGRTIQVPEPVYSLLYSVDSEEIMPALSWNFLNTKGKQRFCMDVGKAVETDLYFLDATLNLGSLGDWLDLPSIFNYVNPRPGVWGGYNTSTNDWDYGFGLVVVQVTFGD